MQVLAGKIADKGYARHYQYLEKEKISLPSLPEQRAIVAKLDVLLGELDRSAAELEGALGKLGVYRQSVLKEAFGGKLTGRIIASAGLQILVRSNSRKV